MQLAASNIAWDQSQDEEMYRYLQLKGYRGLEIAPTRLFTMPVYEKCSEAAEFLRQIKAGYGLSVCSMQSIWYGRTENLFAGKQERGSLLKYTRQAIDFAQACGCGNLVFGCPRNRQIADPSQYPEAVDFFRELGEYALQHETVLSIEANPKIYHTNFINRTEEAFRLVKEVGSKGLLVNLDLGTVIYNHETLRVIAEKLPLVNHVHISEPNLAAIENRELHRELAKILHDGKYNKYVSIEMKNQNDIGIVKHTVDSIYDIFSN